MTMLSPLSVRLIDPDHPFSCGTFIKGGAERWTLTGILGKFLFEAEDTFGPRDMRWTPIGIEFSPDGPMIWYPGDRRHISIVLSDRAQTDPKQACFQLAHEVVHLLAPLGRSDPNVLEEGSATHFSHKKSVELSLGYYSSRPSYIQAEKWVAELLAIDRDAIKRLRV